MTETRDYLKTGRVAAPIAQAMEKAVTDLTAVINGFDDVKGHGGEGKVEPALADHADGFWSWNNGGFISDPVGCIRIASQYESGVPAAARWLVDQYDAGHLEGEQPIGHDGERLEGIVDVDFDDDDISRDWLDGTYRYEVRAFVRGAGEFSNETGEDELILTVGVCPYEPGEQGAWTYQLIDRVEKLSEVTPLKLDAFYAEAKVALMVDRSRAGVAAFDVVNNKRKADKLAERQASQAYYAAQAASRAEAAV
ncbi:hypothetical protein BAJUN_00700 [Bajunvirus bajun]|uniref:Uncharacterized protein n=1 Tax=Brevundimonas phage vB_BgoS-Bajun TaxID=2948594 RepID=A0A9E7N5Z5_9CAUD|nr:hypothetical protein BAJUN_00700 [Brevundimonas phage vB_BgoS-Bajun]